jgi:VWFA-related protein
MFLLLAGIVWGMSSSSSAQSGRKRQPPPSSNGPQSESQPSKNPDKASDNKQSKAADKPMADTTPVTIDENGTIKMDTALVTIPTSVIDRDGKFVPFLTKRDFRIYEDGVEQDIAAFDSIETPFQVVLMIDTSNSTLFRLEDIQAAAAAFTDQLRRDDQVMVVSFDSRVRFLCEFTNDRDRLRRAIYETRTGGSTKLYEAVDQVVDRLEQIQGRKAIVLFTDGVDTSSRRANYRNTVEKVEESGALVYPIRYDTEMDNSQGTFGGRRGTPPIVTPPWPSPSPQGRRRWPLITHQFPQWPQGRVPSQGGGGSSDDYRRGARYLQELAERSGGRLHEADSVRNLTDAFSRIAEELRHQYTLSYYPTNSKKDGTYRQVKVRVEGSGMIVRARDGYRSVAEMQASSDGNANERPELKRKQFAAR